LLNYMHSMQTNKQKNTLAHTQNYKSDGETEEVEREKSNIKQ